VPYLLHDGTLSPISHLLSGISCVEAISIQETTKNLNVKFEAGSIGLIVSAGPGYGIDLYARRSDNTANCLVTDCECVPTDWLVMLIIRCPSAYKYFGTLSPNSGNKAQAHNIWGKPPCSERYHPLAVILIIIMQ